MCFCLHSSSQIDTRKFTKLGGLKKLKKIVVDSNLVSAIKAKILEIERSVGKGRWWSPLDLMEWAVVNITRD
jgi:hypothetical protein